MKTDSSKPNSLSIHDYYKLLAISGGYFCACLIAFIFPDSQKVLMVIWPAAGIGLAALLLCPRRLWPVILLAIFIAGNAANLIIHRPLLLSLGFMTANILESLGCAWFITTMCGFDLRFDRVKNVLALLVAASLVNSLSACIGASVAAIFSSLPFWHFWLAWWISDGLGILIITPFIFAWRDSRNLLSRKGWERFAEASLFMVFWCAMAWFIFNHQVFFLHFYIFPYMLFPLVAWPCFRLGQRSLTTAIILLLVLLVNSSDIISGPLLWGGNTFEERLLLAELYLGFITVLMMLLAATYVERKHAQNASQFTYELLERIIDLIPIWVFWKDKDFKYIGGNESFIKGTGNNSKEDVLGKDDFQMQWKEQGHIYRADDQKVINSGKARLNFEEMAINAKGDQIYVKTSKVPLKDKDGNSIGVLGIVEDITERKQIQELLMQESNFQRAIIENQPGMIWLKDSKGKFLVVNQKFSDACGKNILDILGKTDFDLWPKELAEKYCSDDSNVMREGAPFKCEELINDGGLLKVFETFKMPIFDSFGGIVGTCGFSQDITERKNKEQQIADALNYIECLFSASQVAISTFKASGQTVSVNEAIAKIVGTTIENMKKQNFYELESWKKMGFLEKAQKALDTGQPQWCEGHGVSSYGVEMWLSATFVSFNFGGELYLLVMAMDISERMKMNFALKEREELLKESQIIAGIGNYNLDIPIGTFVSSEGLEKLLGIDKTYEHSVDGWISLIHPDDRAMMEGYFKDNVLKGRQPFNKEYRIIRHSDHCVRWIAGKGKLIIDAQGRILNMYGTIQDITDRKMAEMQAVDLAVEKADALAAKIRAFEVTAAYEQLSKMQTLLIQNEKLSAIGTLSASVAHELNSPLAGILELARFYLKHKNPGDREYQDFEHIVDAAQRMTKIIKGLRDFSRSSTEEIEQLNCNDIIDSVLVFSQRIIMEHHFNVYKNYGEDLPLVNVDKNQMQQVIVNLITNAVDAMQDNGVLRISTRTVIVDESYFVEMEFSDNGCGIKEEDIGRVFDPFFTTKKQGKGTGLGLWVCFLIIDQQHGKIFVESPPVGQEKGTTFRVRIPAIIGI